MSDILVWRGVEQNPSANTETRGMWEEMDAMVSFTDGYMIHVSVLLSKVLQIPGKYPTIDQAEVYTRRIT